MPNEKKFLTVKELAARWGKHKSTLDHWRLQGRGPAFIKLGNQVRYDLEEIKRLESEGFNV